MHETIDEKITLEAIKSSLEVIENNTVEVKQLKESLQNIERLLESLLETANEALGLFEEHQPAEPKQTAPTLLRSGDGNPLPAIFAIGIFVLLSLLIWKWEPVRSLKVDSVTNAHVGTSVANPNVAAAVQK